MGRRHRAGPHCGTVGARLHAPLRFRLGGARPFRGLDGGAGGADAGASRRSRASPPSASTAAEVARPPNRRPQGRDGCRPRRPRPARSRRPANRASQRADRAAGACRRPKVPRARWPPDISCHHRASGMAGKTSPTAARSPIFMPMARRKSGFAEAPQKPLKTARGTSMGGKGTARERAAAGLNPVPGIDMSLEEAEAFFATNKPAPGVASSGGDKSGVRGPRKPALEPIPADAVTATVQALSALIESGRPEFRDKTWVPHRPPRPEKSEGGVSLRDRLRVRAEGRPARGDRRAGRGRQHARSATRCSSASPARARPSPWPR